MLLIYHIHGMFKIMIFDLVNLMHGFENLFPAGVTGAFALDQPLGVGCLGHCCVRIWP